LDDAMVFLERVSFLDPGPRRAAEFPFDVPAIRSHLGAEVSFEAPVTFLVGENGSGKSTFLEGIACAVALPGIGADDPATDPTLRYGRTLAEAIKLRWRLRHPHRGYYFRAEDFFGFTKRMERLKSELLAEAELIRNDRDRSEYARNLGAGVLTGQARSIDARYGASGLDANSHGEQFIELFSARCRPGGIYLMDEPEAPLSPARQLTFLSMLKVMVEEGSQFIIATHSPMLLAMLDARILSFDGGAIREASYETLEHVQIMRTFLADPEAYLRYL
jgi:predicted ATPase